MSSTEASSPSSSQEHISPISTPATTPPRSLTIVSPTAISLAIHHLASTPERPAPGAFKFLPEGTELIWRSTTEPGSPWKHPVLVLPSEDLDSDFVRVLFATTTDIVDRFKARRWGCNYVLIEGQQHPWREALPLAQGAFGRATSIDVTTVYKVRWQDLQEINIKSADGLAPCLSAETLERVVEYVKAPVADMFTPLRGSETPFNTSITPAVQASLDPVLPTPAPGTDPVAALAPVSPQGTGPKYVAPHLRQANGLKRKLSPTAPVFKLHPAHCNASWR
ncbi:hypothetical protein M436DRAFT_61713 [Aureobasidium namibiae CBS 147.97]|uniref:Uncharacterized protein n=1 Tax=Aureobasidium namibiae CBS 147.97 TaxID=1043004 RepID=A0A074WUS6_9PEZI|nr:uncharacterized protein M436DRAFT_61713 [Aureobasidium namibiae CBS 147.97]KEQ75294.1 hypothetical protein M436DRAFT_61713 [Aureobasidium namibiae CBS 147.97]